MKTLILNGSPKKNGDTAALIDAFTSHLRGEILLVNPWDDISPCVDCRYCWQKPGCSIRDGMDRVYDFLPGCDNAVIASPVWFSSLSGPLLSIASRFQTYYAAKRFRGAPTTGKIKSGVILIAGAEPGTEETPIANATSILKMIRVDRQNIQIVRTMDTDNHPAKDDTRALNECRQAALWLNERRAGEAGEAGEDDGGPPAAHF